ncbi:hypothetical protein BC830DRAFT_1084012, partial [Chytriomyces sp. MP71]
MDEHSLPFSACVEDFGSTMMNVYYSSPTTLSAISTLMRATSERLQTGLETPKAEPRFMDLGHIWFRKQEFGRPLANAHLLYCSSGDGRLVIHMATLFGIRATGVDFSPASVAEATENARLAGVSHLCDFVLDDFTAWDRIPEEYTWITAYLPQTVMNRLREVLEGWLKGDLDAIGGPSNIERNPRLFLS